MRIRFLSGYDRIKTLVNIMAGQKKGNAGIIVENISPKPINPSDVNVDISKVISAEIIQKQNKGVSS